MIAHGQCQPPPWSGRQVTVPARHDRHDVIGVRHTDGAHPRDGHHDGENDRREWHQGHIDPFEFQVLYLEPSKVGYLTRAAAKRPGAMGSAVRASLSLLCAHIPTGEHSLLLMGGQTEMDRWTYQQE